MITKGRLGFYVDRTYKVVRQDLINRFKEANIDLTPEQWVLVSYLYDVGECSQKDLANESFKDQPTVSRIVDLLSKKNILLRKQDMSDGRRLKVSLTEEGKQLVEQAKPFVTTSREIGWKGLSEEESNQLVKLLDRVFNNYLEESD